MRDLHDATTSNPDARLAIRMFCYSVPKQIAAMIAALDGVDLIVLTPGKSGKMTRRYVPRYVAAFYWMGIVLDEVRNRAVTNPISDPTSRCAVGTLVANRLTRVDAAEG